MKSFFFNQLKFIPFLILLTGVIFPCNRLFAYPASLRPPTAKKAPEHPIKAKDNPNDAGSIIIIQWERSPDDTPLVSGQPLPLVKGYKIERSSTKDSGWIELGKTGAGKLQFTDDNATKRRGYKYRVFAFGENDSQSKFVSIGEFTYAKTQFLDEGKLWFGGIMVLVCGMVILFILLARSGYPLKVRKIAGLEVVDEAVGRATEMGRTCLFIPGIQDMNDIQTVAGMTVLSSVAKTAAEYDAEIEVPTCRSLVMTSAQETVEASFLAAGRPDAYNAEKIYYVTDEQFGYVAYLSGLMVRDEPAACFYMGAFFAESLILAETGNAIGAIQVAGTAMPSQLPFFVAACDYTLIGEEFFAASAYLSGEADQMGSLKGQDFGKLLVFALVLIGCFLATIVSIKNYGRDQNHTPDPIERSLDYLKNEILKSG